MNVCILFQSLFPTGYLRSILFEIMKNMILARTLNNAPNIFANIDAFGNIPMISGNVLFPKY